MSGHFTIISSPEKVTGQIRARVTNDFNQDVRADAEEMFKFFMSKNLLQAPFAEDHGVAAADNFIHEIHSKEQFLKEVNILANIVNVENTWDVAIYYVGHGYVGNGNWVVGAGEHEVTFNDVMGTWRSGVDRSCSKNLTLITDSCQAGFWVELLRTNPELQNYQIAIIGASNTAEDYAGSSFGRTFVPCWIDDRSVSPPQVPVSFATASYCSPVFKEKLINLVN